MMDTLVSLPTPLMVVVPSVWPNPIVQLIGPLVHVRRGIATRIARIVAAASDMLPIRRRALGRPDPRFVTVADAPSSIPVLLAPGRGWGRRDGPCAIAIRLR